MRKCSKLFRKISVFVLLLALVTVMVNPARSYAQDDITNEEEQNGDGEPSGDALQIRENEQAKSGDISYDTNKPVIEGFEFLQQGQTLKTGDLLKFYVDAYDVDSGVKTIRISLMDGSYGNSLSWDSSTWDYDESNNRYTCEYTLPNVNTEKVSISRIEVIDQNSNYAEWPVQSGSYEYKYWFNTQEDTPIKVKSIVFEQNGKVLKGDDRVGMTFELEEALEESYFTVCFRHQLGNTRYVMANRQETEKTYEWEDWAKEFANGKWTLDHAEINQSGMTRKLLIDDAETYSFTVEKVEADTDKEKPVIQSISIDKNGEICRAGDVVNVTVTAVDNQKLEEYGYVYFTPTADISDGYHYIELRYDEEGKVYRGMWEITEDTYPCEWYISDVYIRDGENNTADTSGFTYGAGYPYYINVYNGNTFVQPSYNINISFLALNEAGSWTAVQQVQKDNVVRRQTLKDLGITFPDVNVKYQDFEHIGWTGQDGNTITEDTQIVGNMGYMTVYAKYDKVLVQASYSYITEDGGYGYNRIEKVYPTGVTYGEVKNDLIKEEAPQEQPKELEFQEWKIENYGVYEDSEPLRGGLNYFSVSAEYDKNFVRFNYSYPNKDGKWVSHAEHPVIMEKDKTYKDALEEGRKYKPEDMKTESFDSWVCDSMINEDMPVPSNVTIAFNAKYEGKTALIAVRSYYDEEGRRMSRQDIVYADDGAVKEDVQKLLDGLKTPEMYQDLKFKGWGNVNNTEFKNGQYLYINADYENCIVRYLIDPIFSTDTYRYEYDEATVETVVCQAADKGEQVSIPNAFEGYENVTWVERDSETDTFEVNGHMTFMGYGQKTGEEPSNPDKPDPDKPDPDKPDPEQPVVPSDPGMDSRPSDELINSVLDSIVITPEGEKIQVDMGSATTVPKEILESAKGKDVDIQLNMEGYTWTINGKDIMSKNFKDINLKVTMDTQNIPNSTIQKLAGDNPVRQLSLAHEGDFGFKASLTVKMGEEFAGQYGNLFYHDSAGKMTFIDAGTISPAGMVTLGFSHASDYVVVMSNEKMAQTSVPSSLQPTGSKGDGSSNTIRKSAKTGDSNEITLLILYSIFALGVIVFIRRRKNA